MQTRACTIRDIKEANKAGGFHWFEMDTMRFFGTRIHPEVFQGPGGTHFITRERDFNGKYMYSVRTFFPDTGSVRTADEAFFAYATLYRARIAATKFANG